MRRELTIATVEHLNGEMKEDTKHRKRHKSESDSAKTEHTDATHKAGHKTADKAHTGKHPPHGAHGSHTGHGSQHDARSRRISRHKMDHGPDHGHGHHDHHGHQPEHDHGHHGRKISRDHGYHDDHHHMSASSHPIRPQRDTMSRHSHYESDRRSTGTVENNGPVVFYENTYKLTPGVKFHEGSVKNVIREVLKEHITEALYDPNMCGAKCKHLSEIIKERVKKLHIHRFKIISVVMIGQVFDQSMLVTSRCLWDHRFDNSVSVEYKKGDILAVGLVFAVYHE